MAKYQTNSKETQKPDHKQFKHPAQNRMAFQIHTSQKSTIRTQPKTATQTKPRTEKNLFRASEHTRI